MLNEIGTTTVKDLVKLVKEGGIVSYEHNRGDGLLKESKIRRYMQNWNRFSAGRISLAECGDRLKVADGHHRIAALTRGYDAGKISGDEPISYCVMPNEEFMRAYIDNNEMGNGHKARNKLLCPDLAVGSFIHPFLRDADLELKGKFLSQLACVVYCYKNSRPMDYISVYKTRKEIRDLLDVPAGSAPIFPKNGDSDIREAIKYYKETMDCIESRFLKNGKGSTIMDQTTKKIVNNASLFGIVVADALSVKPSITTRKPERLAEKILAKNAGLINLLVSVTSSSEERQRETYNKIVGTLK